MEARARTSRLQSRLRISGCSSMLRFFRSVVGSKGKSKGCNKVRAGEWPLWWERDAVHSRGGCWPGHKKKEPDFPDLMPKVISVASSRLLLQDAFGLGDEDKETLRFMEALKLKSQGVNLASLPPRRLEEVVRYLYKIGEGEEQEGEASEASSRIWNSCLPSWDLEQACLQWTPQPPMLRPKGFSRAKAEGQDQHGELRMTSSKAGSTAWNHLLRLYKHLQSAMAKFPHRESLVQEKEEKETEEEDSSLQVSIPLTATFQLPLHKTFRSSDTVGFVELELKKILAVQRESRLWKLGGLGGRELLTQPEVTLEEAGMVDGQHLLLEEIDEMGNWPSQ